MKKLHKLIISTYIGPFIITFFITLFIFVMQFLWKYIDDLVGKGIEPMVVGELLFYASANLVPMALPLSILLSAIMTFGSLGEHYELAALKSAGLSLPKIMRPLIIFILITCGTAFYFSNNIWPLANLKMRTILYSIRKTKPALDIREKAFYKGIDGFVIRADSKDKDGQTLYDLSIYDHTEKKGNKKVIKAKKGRMHMSKDESVLILNLSEGYSYEDVESDNKTKDNFPMFRSKFKEETIRFDLSGFAMKRTDETLFKNNYQMLNVTQLDASIDTLVNKTTARKQQYRDIMDTKIGFLNDSISLPSINNQTSQSILLDTLHTQEKIKIYQTAIQIARNNQSLTQNLGDELNMKNKIIARHKIEWHRKFTLSAACLILFFIGAPLGAIIRKGGLGLPTVISVIFFLFYHVLNMITEKMVKGLELDAHIGMWISSVVLTPIGIFLTYKASTDSVLLDRSFYLHLLKPFNKIFKLVLRKSAVSK